jgi:hypothetical protein
MNKTRLILTMVVIFVLANLAGIFIHAIWLRPDYLLVVSQNPNLFRPNGQEKMPWIVLGYIAFAVGSVWVYAHGVQDKPLLIQGVRFGIAMWLVLTVPSFFIAYGTQPIPALLMSKQVLCELVAKIFLGVVTALVYGKGRVSSTGIS